MRALVKKLIPRQLFRRVEPFGHLLEAITLNILNGFPARDIKVIGITGTNGKTTTTFLVHRMLHEAGYKVGMMSTVAYGVGNDIKQQMTHMTTSSVPVLLKRFKDMKAQGVEWVVLETTSHALAQHRVWHMPYSIAVLTNITHEHLSYHGTFERYVMAKRMLFRQTDKNKHGQRLGIINAEDPSAEIFADAIENVVFYGTGEADLRATNIKLTPDQVTYDEGRMMRIDEGQNFTVIVDYAHTPDSYEKLFQDLKPVVKGKLFALFGSLGGGDEAKRAQQGQLAGLYTDEVIITEEDDRQEDPARIRRMIAEGVEQSSKRQDRGYFIIDKRPEAIQFVMNRAKKGDTVLLLGKGHEKTIEDATGEHPWDEVAEARKALKNRAKPAE